MSKIFETQITIPDGLVAQAQTTKVFVTCQSTRLAQNGETIGTLWVANCTSSGVESYASDMREQIEKAALKHTDTKVLAVMFFDEYKSYVAAGIFNPCTIVANNG